MFNLQKQTIITEIPSISHLNYYTLNIASADNNYPMDSIDFQRQKLKTRYLIWQNPSMLAAPVSNDVNLIHLIIPRSLSRNSVLAIVEKQQMILSGPFELTNLIYQCCITYSFYFRLSPVWNRISDVWIKSQDVLKCAHTMPAISWEPQVCETIMVSTVKPLNTRLPLVDLSDYNVNKEQLWRTGRACMTGPNVYSLPQMRACTPVSVMTSIPEDCPYKNYSIMRKHWKNVYGLRLPHDESMMLYIQIRFPWSPELFTYPFCCIRSCNVVKMGIQNGEEIICTFAQDIVTRCGNICGTPLCFNTLDNMPLKMIVEEKKYPTTSFLPDFPNTPNLSLVGLINDGMPDCEVNRALIPEVHQKKDELIFGKRPLPQFQMTQGNIAKNLFVPKFQAKYNPQLIASGCVNNQESTSVSNSKKQVDDSCSQLKYTPTFTPKVALEACPKKKVVATITKKIIPTTSPDVCASTSIPLGCLKPPMKMAENMSTLLKRKSTSVPVDVEDLVKMQKLSKATVPHLRDYCNANNISYKYKDKKESLVRLIYDFHGICP